MVVAIRFVYKIATFIHIHCSSIILFIARSPDAAANTVYMCVCACVPV